VITSTLLYKCGFFGGIDLVFIVKLILSLAVVFKVKLIAVVSLFMYFFKLKRASIK